jgi:hypothetical protein
LREARGFSEVIVNRRGKEEWERRINVVSCTLLGVWKRKKIQGYMASSLCPLQLGCSPVPAQKLVEKTCTGLAISAHYSSIANPSLHEDGASCDFSLYR